MQTYLNETYYSTLSSDAKSQIQEVTWKLGGYDSIASSAKEAYTYERTTNDESGDPAEWTGKIALMYASDYGYASTNESCLNALNTCDDTEAINNNWIFMSQVESGETTSHYNEWLLTQYYYNYKFSYNAYSLRYPGWVKFVFTNSYNTDVRPSLHLSQNVLRVSGDGSADNHFVIK